MMKIPELKELTPIGIADETIYEIKHDTTT